MSPLRKALSMTGEGICPDSEEGKPNYTWLYSKVFLTKLFGAKIKPDAELAFRRGLKDMSNKTQPTSASVSEYLQGIDPKQQTDCQQLLQLCRRVSAQEPVMWGSSIIGFGQYQYHYASGRQGRFFRLGFAPRKQNLVLYLMPGYLSVGELLQKLYQEPNRTPKMGKSCLYLKSLQDVRLNILEQIAQLAYNATADRAVEPAEF